jgi:phosphoenolpyruvate carboxylase
VHAIWACIVSHAMKRQIPATMATQHPDNARSPFWKKENDPFVSVHEEPEEAILCLRDLGVQEFMWDWEGKYADESVIDKLFSNHHTYFKKNQLGRKKFLTFRLPNVWKEKGYSLIRALMVILTSEDFALDLSFTSRPLFEVILPMTERAEQLLYIQKSFKKLARFKSSVFKHRKNNNEEYLEIIPLVEGVDDQIHIAKLLCDYVRLHRKHFGCNPAYIRPFLARSDPALINGFIPNTLANKIALSDIYDFGIAHRIPVYPIIGAGSLIFRGGANPERARQFVKEYGGARTITIQSAFRYDYPLAQVKKALRYFEAKLPKSKAQHISDSDRPHLLRIIELFSETYQDTVARILPDLQSIFAAVPKRRERRQHIGLLGYGRTMGKNSLPRAINFTAALYSIGAPPEFIGLGRSLSRLSEREKRVLGKYYLHLKEDIQEAGRYINRDAIKTLAKKNPAWLALLEDITLAEHFFGLQLGPKKTDELLHRNLSSQLLLRYRDRGEMSRLVAETGKLRKSLG